MKSYSGRRSAKEVKVLRLVIAPTGKSGTADGDGCGKSDQLSICAIVRRTHQYMYDGMGGFAREHFHSATVRPGKASKEAFAECCPDPELDTEDVRGPSQRLHYSYIMRRSP